MDIVIVPLLKVAISLLGLYGWAVLAMVVLNWLTAFNIVNGYNRFVFLASGFLFKITEPPLRHIRQIIPSISGLDLSPMALILLIWLLQEMLSRIAMRFI